MKCMSDKGTKSQPLTIQLELLDCHTLWNIFEVYAEELTIKQLKVIHEALNPQLPFSEWLENNGLLD